MAETFEKEGNFDRAQTEYKFLIEKYRGSEEALAAHLHLAGLYDSLGRTAAASRWRQEAARACQELAARGGGSRQQAIALFWQARLAQQQDDWAQAAEILAGLFERFPDTEIGRRGLLRSADIYRNRLGRPEQADSLMLALRSALARADVWPDENADPLN
jgi:tetratricopeptide (TPR) repeat protein